MTASCPDALSVMPAIAERALVAMRAPASYTPAQVRALAWHGRARVLETLLSDCPGEETARTLGVVAEMLGALAEFTIEVDVSNILA